MKFDKSKFKKQSIEDVEAEVKQAEKTMYKGSKSYTGFATVQKGKNVFRVVPAMGKAYVACKMSKLRVEVPTYDANGKVTGKEVKDKNVFCADIHGKNLLKGKDPIVLYCDYVRKRLPKNTRTIQNAENSLTLLWDTRKETNSYGVSIRLWRMSAMCTKEQKTLPVCNCTEHG